MQVNNRTIKAVTLSVLMGCAFGSAHAAVISPVSASLVSGAQAYPDLAQSNIAFVVDGIVDAGYWYGVAPSSGTIRLSLGGTFDLESVTIWNNAGGISNDNEGIQSFSLDFFDSTLAALGSYSDVLPDNELGHVRAFNVSDVAYVDLVIRSGYSASYALFYEIAFEGAKVPEPAANLLIGLGLVGLMAQRKRRGAGAALVIVPAKPCPPVGAQTGRFAIAAEST
jgi:hypothetical protein